MGVVMVCLQSVYAHRLSVHGITNECQRPPSDLSLCQAGLTNLSEAPQHVINRPYTYLEIHTCAAHIHMHTVYVHITISRLKYL